MGHRRLHRSLVVAIVALAGWPLGALAAPIDRQTFNADMRKLWEDHITWTRLYIVDAIGGLPEKAATTQRLLQNQVDLGNAIKPFYGDAAGAKLTSLLRDHILIAAELIDAAKAGDSADMLSSGIEAQFPNQFKACGRSRRLGEPLQRRP